ncbi:MAG: type I restriction enzyme endonuclease domain-containing protein [Pseudomonadota bacterium]
MLRKYGYPPDKQETATQTVLRRAEVVGFTMAASDTGNDLLVR